MLASELIRELVKLKHTHGDLPVTGHLIDTKVGMISVLDKDSCDIYSEGAGSAKEFFLE